MTTMVGKGQASAKEQSTNESAEDVSAELARMEATSFDFDTLANIKTADDVERLFAEAGVSLTDASDLGDGFAVVSDKAMLIGKPFIVLQWRELLGNFGPFIAAHIVTRDAVDGNIKFVLVDGSSGIREQLAYYEEKTGRSKALLCKRGLRASEYEFCETHRVPANNCKDLAEEHDTHPAKTYYIDTSA